MTSSPSQASPLVSVIVPTLNEAENIDPLMEQLTGAFQGAAIDVEVLVADGHSTDGTQDKVRQWSGRAPVRLIDAASGRGLAGDVLAAAGQARAEVIVVMDADLSHDPQVAPELARPILDGTHDMIIGSRHVPGGSNPNWPWLRRLISRAAAALAWPLVDVSDPMSGFFAIRRKHLLAVDAEQVEGFKIGLEALLRGGEAMRVAERPITFHDRTHGQSKMNRGQALAYLRRMTALAGGAVSPSNAWRFALVGLIGLAVDLGTFQLLYSAGMGLAKSHILSFTLATIINYVLNSRWAFRATSGQKLQWRAYLRFLTVCLMALFLRGGVLAMLVDKAGWPAQGGLVVAVFAAALINYLGCAFFVFTDFEATSVAIRWRVAAVGLVGYTVLLRLVYLGLADLLPEEAYYWNYAQHPALSYLDHPPMVAWLIHLGTALAGDTELGVRLGTFLCWFITAGFCYGLARHLFDKATAMRTVLLVAILPFFFVFGYFTTPDAPLICCWAAVLYFAERALLGGRRWAWVGVGVALGLGMLSKYTIVLLGPTIVTFVLLDRSSRRWLLRPEPYLAVALTVVLFLPVLIWNHEHNYVSFTFQGARRLHESAHFGLPMLLVDMALLLTPVGLVGAIQALTTRQSWLGPLAPPRSIVRRQRLFTVVFTAAPLLVFVLFSFRHDTKPNWTGPVWLAVLPALARQLGLSTKVKTNRLEAFGQGLWTPTLAITILLFGGLFHYLAIGLPGLGYSTHVRLPVAWEELGGDVEHIENQIVRKPGNQDLLVVGMDKYFTASELAFYRREGREGVEQTTTRHLFGGSGLMYAYWFPPKKQAGRTLLLISFNADDLADARVARWFSHVDPIHERQLLKHGQPVGPYYYRVGYDYQPLDSPSQPADATARSDMTDPPVRPLPGTMTCSTHPG